MTDPLDVNSDVDDSLLREFARFVREERKWLLAPLLLVLGAVSVLIVFLQGSALAPFVYPFF